MIEVDVKSVVKGDVVHLQAGQKAPADLRMFEVKNLKIDLSSFTGEAEPQARTIDNTNEVMLNATNMSFYTCSVLVGEGNGIVVETGDKTQIGY